MNGLKILIFTIAITAFYSYVGQMVPQKVTYPPEEIELGENMTTEQMVEVGAELVAGKGTCLGCHTMGDHSSSLRFPDLAGIGNRAGSMVDGMSDIEYLAESLYEPNTFVVEGFVAGMPAVHRPPIGMNDQEILTVIAYLQSLGGTPSVTMETVHSFTGLSPAAEGGGGAAPAAAAPVQAGASGDGPSLYAKFMCNTCHAVDGPTQLVGPSLYDVGNRLSGAEIYESIMDPDAVIADGYTPGVMSAMMAGLYDSMTKDDLKVLVDYLSSLKG